MAAHHNKLPRVRSIRSRPDGERMQFALYDVTPPGS
jgi:hypothetical protein